MYGILLTIKYRVDLTIGQQIKYIFWSIMHILPISELFQRENDKTSVYAFGVVALTYRDSSDFLITSFRPYSPIP